MKPLLVDDAMDWYYRHRVYLLLKRQARVANWSVASILCMAISVIVGATLFVVPAAQEWSLWANTGIPFGATAVFGLAALAGRWWWNRLNSQIQEFVQQ